VTSTKPIVIPAPAAGIGRLASLFHLRRRNLTGSTHLVTGIADPGSATRSQTSVGNWAGSTSAGRYALIWLVALCGLVGSLAFGYASAGAAITHAFRSRITEVAAGPGVASSGPIVDPQAMTVDAGSLYVADGGDGNDDGGPGGGRLDKFNAASGALELQFGQVPSLSFIRQGVAVGHATGEVYVGADEFVEGVPMGAIAVFNPAGGLQKIWNGADTPDGGFGCFECQGGPSEVAIDNNTSSLNDWAAGDVYVTAAEHEVVDVFKPKAGGGEEYVTQLAERELGVPFSEVTGVAVDQSTGDVVVLEARGVDVFEPTVLDQYALASRQDETQAGHPLGPLDGVAVDGGDGDIYVSEQGSAGYKVVDQFSSAGVYLGSLKGTPSGPFGSQPAALAVDPNTHDLYVGESFQYEPQAIDIFGPTLTIPDVTTAAASGLKVGDATLNGTVDPEAIQLVDCRFDYGTSTEYGQSAPCVPTAGSIPADSAEHPVTAQLAGLAPDTTYHFRLQASNGNGTNSESEDLQFTTPGPGIHRTSVVEVTSNSATLEASIDPNNATTTYYFQYGTSTGYGSEAPAAPGVAVGAGKGDVEVSQPVRLTPSVVYHYRVVVKSEPVPGEPIEEDGPDQTFTTQGPQGPGLPDGRAWEMVSPPNKHGATLEALSPKTGGLTQAATDGSALAYLANAPVDADPSGNRSLLFTQVLATRGPEGWTSRGITTPNETPAWSPELTSDEYRLFSSNLTAGLVQPDGDTPLSPAASEPTPYRREANGEFTPLVTAANVPPGTEFGGTRGVGGNGGIQFAGASPDLNHVVIESPVALTEQTVSGPKGLYEWNEGALSQVSILPNEKSAAEEGLGAALGNSDGFGVRHAVSDDGSRVIWTTGGGNGELLVRDMRLKETVRIDVAETGAQGGVASPRFQIASSDDSKVFFTDQARLTKDATSNPGEPDLYMCEVGESSGKLACTLKDLSVDENAREAADVEQNVLGASEDGRYVYFAANGAIAPGAAPEHCRPPGASFENTDNGSCNIYVYDTVTNERRLVAALSNEDYSDWDEGNGGASILQTEEVSSDGQYLAFMSLRSLTGYDNIDARSGQPDTEVFLYDASSGKLVCASCNPTGARPVGVFDALAYPGLLVDRYEASAWDNHWLAGSIPGAQKQARVGNGTWYQSHYLSNSGRLFFNSADALVPQDTNGLEDVYEYEPAGVSSTCTEDAGCVGLISSGTSDEESALLDASESGDDVFFLTAAQLVPEDVDSALDVYDAHVCSASSPCVTPGVAPVAPVPCASSDACHAASTPQPEVFGAPASTSAPGPGNLAAPPVKPVMKVKAVSRAQKLAKARRACKKKPKGKRRASCEAKARRLYGKGVKAKRAENAGATKGKR
jgi:hypothetical protein